MAQQKLLPPEIAALLGHSGLTISPQTVKAAMVTIAKRDGATSYPKQAGQMEKQVRVSPKTELAQAIKSRPPSVMKNDNQNAI